MTRHRFPLAHMGLFDTLHRYGKSINEISNRRNPG